MSSLKCGDHNCTAYRDLDDQCACVEAGSLFFFVLEISSTEPFVLCLFQPLDVFGDDGLHPLFIFCPQLLIRYIMVVICKYVIVENVNH